MNQLVPIPAARTPSRTRSRLVVPAAIAGAGDTAVRRFLEFFVATIRNKNTRMAYFRAVTDFFAWLDAAGIVALVDIEPLHVATYIEAPGLRDRALIGVMTYAFARIGAVVSMRVEDYFANGKRWWVRLHEKGGKRHEMPTHHKLEAFLDEYLRTAGIAGDERSPLFRSAVRRTGTLAMPDRAGGLGPQNVV